MSTYACADPNREAARELAHDLGVPAVYDSYCDLLDVEHPDVIGICTPPSAASRRASGNPPLKLAEILTAAGGPAPGSADTGPDPAYRIAHRLIGSRYISHGPRPHESRFRVHADKGHAVTRSTGSFGIRHEHYRIEAASDVRVIAWRRAAGGREPIAYVRRAGRGRVCYLQLGHDMRAWDDPPVRDIVTRAARWAHGEGTR